MPEQTQGSLCGPGIDVIGKEAPSKAAVMPYLMIFCTPFLPMRSRVNRPIARIVASRNNVARLSCFHAFFLGASHTSTSIERPESQPPYPQWRVGQRQDNLYHHSISLHDDSVTTSRYTIS